MTAINEDLTSKFLAHYTYLPEHSELRFEKYAISKYICNGLKQNDVSYEIVAKTKAGKLHTPEFQAAPAALDYSIRTHCSQVVSPKPIINHRS